MRGMSWFELWFALLRFSVNTYPHRVALLGDGSLLFGIYTWDGRVVGRRSRTFYQYIDAIRPVSLASTMLMCRGCGFVIIKSG
jgi:hypothetical protein